MKLPWLVLLAVSTTACPKKQDASSASDGATAGSSSSAAAAMSAPTTQPTASSGGLAGFEGDVSMSILSPPKPPQTIVYTMKGTKTRFDAPLGTPGGHGNYVIFDSTTKKLMTVSDVRKVVMTMDMPTAPGGAMGAMPGKQPKMEDTNKTDVVAGMTCEVWQITEDSGAHSEACMAKGFPFPRMMGSPAPWASDIGADLFPLRLVSHDPAGKELVRMEVTSITKRSVDDAQLAAPAGYRTIDVPGMGGMMRGGFPH